MHNHARKFATGDFSVASQNLRNELARAMLCLTDVKRKKEYDISLRSAEIVLKYLNKKKYTGYIIHLKNNEFTVLTKDNYLKINEKDFSFIKNNKKIKIDQVFMALQHSSA